MTLILCLALAALCWGQSNFVSVTYTPQRILWFDNRGDQIDAYGAQIKWLDDKYWMWGSSLARNGKAQGVKYYSSLDLLNWEEHGYLYDPNLFPARTPSEGSERPQLVFRRRRPTGPASQREPATLWISTAEGPRAFNLTDPNSVLLGVPQLLERPMHVPRGLEGRRIADFSVTDDAARDLGFSLAPDWNWGREEWSFYPCLMAFTSVDEKTGTRSLHVGRLDGDCRDMTDMHYQIVSDAKKGPDEIDLNIHSPHLYFFEGFWYILASTSFAGYERSMTIAYQTTNVTHGPWTRYFVSNSTCGGQLEGGQFSMVPGSHRAHPNLHATAITPIRPCPKGQPCRRPQFNGHILLGGTYADDRPRTARLADFKCKGGLLANAMLHDGDESSLDEKPFFARALKATVKTPQHAEYYPVCDSDRYTLYQTWDATKTGNLTELAFNIAATEETEVLNVEVFRVENEGEDLTHRNPLWFTWVPRTEFSYTLSTVRLHPNRVYVHAGDRMGFKIASRDRKPYCHAEYQKGEVVCGLNKEMNIKTCGPELNENGQRRHILYQESLAEGPQEIVVRNSTMKFYVYIE